MAGKAKFDQEAAFKSIIGAGATEDEKKADKPAGKGRPPVERETKKRVSLALYPSSYGALQKIAYVNKTGLPIPQKEYAFLCLLF